MRLRDVARAGVLLIGTLIFANTVNSVGAEIPTPTIDELRVPSSPAFILLDISPTSVERPSTPRALAISLLSATERSSGKLPQDLALEVAPYWWKARPNLTFDDYYYGKDRKGKALGTTILQTMAISLATTDLKDKSDNVPNAPEGTRAGLGLRFSLRQGKPAQDLKAKVDEAVKQLKALQTKFLNECVGDEPGEPLDEACVAESEPKLKKAAQAVTREVARMDMERRGWTVESAAAVTADFLNDETRDRKIHKAGAWITASYRSVDSNLTFVGVGRYFRDKSLADPENNYDLGARLIWTADPGAMPPLALSLEYVRRFAPADRDAHKLVGVLEYRLPLDNLSIVASYGKTFENDPNGKEDLVAILGINLGLGHGPVVSNP